MNDKGPEIRKLARANCVVFTRHAIDRIRQYHLTTMQVVDMLKNCSHNQRLDDSTGYRMEGKAAASNAKGMQNISAHVKFTKNEIGKRILITTVING
jgi:hypothetical protein